MNKKYLKLIILECSKYITEEQHDAIFSSLNRFKDIITFLDYINISVYDLKTDKKISNYNYKKLLNVLDRYYENGEFYSINRVDWIKELRDYDKSISLNDHHQNLLNYFSLLNKRLNDNDIDYFHASGFMCCLLINKKLERYHHDIDLYINIKDIDKIKNIFNNDKFNLVHTCEKDKKNIFRHGYKIESSIYNIPIWLSFYKQLADGTIYMQEYYQNMDGSCFTKENYNSPLCCELSLVKHSYRGISFTSLSLEALFVSKRNNRKKDIFDCNMIEKSIDHTKTKILEKELYDVWNIIDGLPKEMEKAFFCSYMEERDNAKTFTKKRI